MMRKDLCDQGSGTGIVNDSGKKVNTKNADRICKNSRDQPEFIPSENRRNSFYDDGELSLISSNFHSLNGFITNILI
jgi:hypothetical protein